ncbi:E3 ubiquitin-protein ligase listerin-like [Antedon mediterranea]|uniref:E3 ubiquitin-protein ligase listerin-like n=1 Tax=Antedon mediterranea TaxID=105859 RepID=UPI003AF768D4
MGGKQRTKGNARPSSSGRAAELLERSNQGTGFVGFGTMSGDLGYVPTAVGADDFDSCLDPEIRLALRKLTKRDAITKLKAMQELASLCKEKEEDSVGGILPHWPRLYSKLALDYDKRVREATQYAFEQICLRVGRKLAPHLRSLMGVWIVSQCDTYAPASSAAKSAFQKAFSTVKQREAVAYCKAEVLEHLQDNLFNQTASTLSEAKSTPVEELEEKYTRNLTSSLLALRELITMLSPEELPKISEQLENILINNKFWKFVKHQKPSIRSAFYTVIGAYCEHIPETLEIYLMRSSVNVLGNLDESDPTVVSSLWHAALLIITTYPKCWSHVNMRKAVLPKLWVLLKSGGKGSATVIYPNLLPLLSQLPAATFGQGIGFFQEFFGNMKTGLILETVRRSSCETSSIVQALMECVRYCIIQNLGNSENCIAIQDYLVNEQVMPLLEESMTQSTKLASTSLYPQTSSLIHRLHKSNEDKHINDSCKRILNSVWGKLAECCLKQICSEDPSLKNLENISTVLSQIRSPLERKTSEKRKIHVTFSDSTTSLESSDVTQVDDELTEKDLKAQKDETDSKIANSTSNEKMEDDQMNELVAKLCSASYKLAKEQNSAEHCFFFSKILSEFSSPDLFKTLTHLVPCDDSSTKSKAYQFIDKAILPWINDVLAVTGKCNLCQNLVDALFSVMKLCSCEEQREVLGNLCCLDKSIVPLYLAVKKIVISKDVHIQSWTRSTVFGDKLTSLAGSLCGDSKVITKEEEISDGWKLISLGLSTNKNRDPILDDLYTDRLIKVICKLLQDLITTPSDVTTPLQDDPSTSSAVERESEDIVHLKNMPHSLTYICETIFNFFKSSKNCFLVSASEDVLLKVFQISCLKGDDLSGDLMEKVQNTWMYGITSLVENKKYFSNAQNFLHKLAGWIKVNLMKSSSLVDRSTTIANATSLVYQVLNENINQDCEDIQMTGGEFLQLILPTKEEWNGCRRSLPLQWKENLTMQGDLMLINANEKLPETFQDDVPNQIMLSVFLATLLTIQPQLEEDNVLEYEEVRVDRIPSKKDADETISKERSESKLPEQETLSKEDSEAVTAGESSGNVQPKKDVSEREDPISAESSNNGQSSDNRESSDNVQPKNDVSEREDAISAESSNNGQSSDNGESSDNVQPKNEREDAISAESSKSMLPWNFDKMEDYILEVVYSMQWSLAISNSEQLVCIFLQDSINFNPFFSVEDLSRFEQTNEEEVMLPGYLKQSSPIISAAMDTVWAVLTINQWDSLISKSCERSMEFGELWAMTLKCLIEKFKEYEAGQELKVIHICKTDRFDILTEESVGTLKVLIPYLQQNDISMILDIHTAKLITSPQENITEIHGCLGALCVIHTCLLSLTKVTEVAILEAISDWKDFDIFLFSRKVEDVGCKVLFLNVEVIRFLSVTVQKIPRSLSAQTWDFILCSLVEWIQSITDSITDEGNSIYFKVFCAEISNLIHAIVTLLEDENASKAALISPDLISEWKEFFSPGIFTAFLPLFFKFTNSLDQNLISVSDHLLLQSVCRAACCAPCELLQQVELKPRLVPSCTIPDVLQTVMNHLMGMLQSKVRPIQLAAYKILAKLMSLLPEYDKGRSDVANTDETGETNLPLPEMLKEAIISSTFYLESVLEDVPVGECITVESGTEVYQTTMTYLLAWRLALIFFKAAPVELRAQYANFFRQSGLVDSLLINLFRLMPIVPLLSDKDAKSPFKGVQPSMFTQEPALEIKGCGSSPIEPQHLACSVYNNTLEDLPAMVRQWWNSQNKRIKEHIDRFTTKFTSPILCAKEIQGVQKSTTKMDNMTIKARSKTREVIATYRMDDMSMDLVIKLAVNHPLGVIVVDSGKRVGVSAAQWRNWMLQMTTFLVHQNGTIVDGLKVWKSNIDKRFEGTDDCMICYSVIHGSNYSLPQLTCKTCKKKFHSACLYKWFNTSNQSSCPLCRNLF